MCFRFLSFWDLYAWDFIRQCGRSNRSRSPQSGEKIRSGRFFPMEEAIPEEVRMAPPPETRKKKRSVKQEKQPEKEQKQVSLQTEKPEEDRSEYAFRTPSDARRAFIYSEIFRRKYD